MCDHGLCHGDTPWLTQGLNAGRNVYRIAKEAIAFDNHLSDIDPDAKTHLSLA
jgi:hypothetical protein